MSSYSDVRADYDSVVDVNDSSDGENNYLLTMNTHIEKARDRLTLFDWETASRKLPVPESLRLVTT